MRVMPRWTGLRSVCATTQAFEQLSNQNAGFALVFLLVWFLLVWGLQLAQGSSCVPKSLVIRHAMLDTYANLCILRCRLMSGQGGL